MTALEDALLDRYERFTGVLCQTAQYGDDARRERTYAEIRDWMRANHDGLVHLLGSADISGPLLALFEAATLKELLEEDDGDLILNVGRISESLYQNSLIFGRR